MALIKEHFSGNTKTIKDEYKEHCSYINLVDMLDFNRVEFNKSINLSINKKVEIESKYPLVKLGEYCENITKGTTPTTLGFDFIDRGINFIKIESILQDGNYDKSKFAFINEECNQKMLRSQLKKNDILFSIAGALGRTAIVSDDILPANTNQAISIIRLKLNTNFKLNYLYQVLRGNIIQSQIDGLKVGIAQPNLSLTQIGNFKIPLPPLEIQEEIVRECQKVDDEVLKANETIEKNNQDIVKLIQNATIEKTLKLSDVCELKAGKFVSANEIFDENDGTLYPCFGGNGQRGYTKTYTHDGSYPLIGRQGALCGNITLAEGKFHATEHAVAATSRINLDVIWLYHKLILMDLNQYKTGTAQPGLSVKNLNNVTIELPSFQVQKQIALKIRELESSINEAQKVIDSAKEKKEAILRKYL